MDELAAVLRKERHLLEILLFKLVEARHLLAASEMRFLAWAADEVERAVERVRGAEIERGFIVEKIARELNLSAESLTLRALAEETPEPYRSVFTDHRTAFLELVAEIETVAQANRKLAGQGMRGIQEVLQMIDAGRSSEPPVRLYGPNASTHSATSLPSARFDGAL